ncbi:MAG: hypothetical protein L0338_21390 [Acidobacteria bacterium]|nr:hypothetical protein [Acidobacteriota bacterium]
MTYAKPQVVPLMPACEAIQGQSKDNTTYLDGVHPLMSISAYEVDE